MPERGQARLHFTDYDTRLAAYALIREGGRVLLTWFNGLGGGTPQWTLPGGGVEFGESLEEAVRREVLEETGYTVAVGRPLLTDSFTESRSWRRDRPFQSVRVVFEATVVSGSLGTTEVDGSTDFARWVSRAELSTLTPRAQVLDLAIDALHAAD